MDLSQYKGDDIRNKRIFIRVDFNVPIENGVVQDNFKIISSIPTVLNIYKHNPISITLGSHLGRPNGKRVMSLSMYPVFSEFKKQISGYLDIPVIFQEVENYEENKQSLTLLENLRFYKDEEENIDEGLLRSFFENYIDVVVIDAFGCLHRDNFSITNTKLPAFCGDLVKKELDIGYKVLQDGIDLLILGGSKVSDKIKMIKALITKCKSVFLVGKLSQEFLNHLNKKARESDRSFSKDVSILADLFEKYVVKLYTPVDYKYESKNIDVIPSNKIIGKDIGEKTIGKLTEIIGKYKNIFWNGPPGVFEEEQYAFGTKEMINILENHEGKVIVGGGETSYSVRKFSDINNFYHVSTGGGAFIKLLSGEKLPGVEILKNQ